MASRFFRRNELSAELRMPKFAREYRYPATNPAELAESDRLHAAMRDLQREETSDQKMRQWIRENSVELQDLKRNIQKAYSNKALHLQLQEQKAVALENKIKEKLCNKSLEESAKVKEMIAQENASQLRKKQEYLVELQNQIVSRERERMGKYRDYLQEKALIDGIAFEIDAEDEALRQTKICHTKKVKEESEQFQIAQAAWKKRQREILEDENKKLVEYAIRKDQEARLRKQMKDEADAEKEKFLNAISQRIYKERMEKKEREDIISECLHFEEQDAAEKRHKAELENDLRKRIANHQSYIEQVLEKEEKKRQEALENARFHEQLLAKALADEKVEQLTNEKKRLRKIQIRKDLDLQYRLKQERILNERQSNVDSEKQLAEEWERRQQLIEEERIKLLKEHAKDILDYIPPNVLRPGDEVHLNLLKKT